MAAPAPDTEPKPRGLLGLWRARRGFVYRFEKRRMRLARSRFWRVWVFVLFCTLFALFESIVHNSLSPMLIAGGLTRLSPWFGGTFVY